MSPSQGEPIGLDSVKPPPTPPSPEPDPQTLLEESDLRRLRELAKSAPLHRTVISERETSRLAEDCRELRRDCLDLRSRLDSLGPRYAALRRAYSDLRGAAGGSTLVMFVGGVVVSIAGALDPGTAKPVVLAVGITASACGLF